MTYPRVKINTMDQVCPWEETFMNLVEKFDSKEVGVMFR